MKIILASSKTQNLINSTKNPHKQPLNMDLSINLFNKIKELSKDSLGNAFKIKGSLLEDTYNIYNTFKHSNEMVKAINCYDGVVFNEIKQNDYNLEQLSFMNQNLTILSAMYGVIEPDTYIWPYRLDMTVKINSINLYKYWQEEVENYFLNEDIIINLSSNEFSKMLNKFKNKMINIHFCEKNKDCRLKVLSYNAKKARGIMTDKIIIHKISRNDINQIKNFEIDGYKFDCSISDDKNYYFIKDIK